MNKKLLGLLGALIVLVGVHVSTVNAITGDTLDAFKVISTSTITPRNASNTLQIPVLASSSCIGANTSGTFFNNSGSCGGGGGGSSTISINGISSGTFTFASTSPLTLTASGTTFTFGVNTSTFATGTVNGTGTVNYFPIWNGTTTLSSTSTLSQSSTNLDIHGGVILDPTGGSGVPALVSNPNNVPNYSQVTFHPFSGTNVNQTLSVIPRGTGQTGNIAQMTVFGTDFIADPNNYNAIALRAVQSAYNLTETAQGTGSLYPFAISASNNNTDNELYLTTSSKVGVDTIPNTTFDVKAATDQHFNIIADGNAGDSGAVGVIAANDAYSLLVPMALQASRFNFETGPVDIGTRTPDAAGLTIIKTLPGSPTGGLNYGAHFDITSAGTATAPPLGFDVDLEAGYTGTSGSYGFGATNAVISAANNPWTITSSAKGNLGGYAFADGNNTTGWQIGGYFGSYNVANGGAPNVGVIGLANYSGSTLSPQYGGIFLAKYGSTNVGVYAGLVDSAPTIPSAALIADNGSVSAPIFLGRTGGATTLFEVDAMGNVSTTVNSYVGGTLTASTSIINQSVKNALVLNNSTGLEGSYAGSSCTNQAVTGVSATGTVTCGTFATSTAVLSKVTTYNGITTAGQGLSPIVMENDTTANTSGTTIGTYTPTATTTLEIGGYVNITAIVTDVLNYRVTWTDENGTSQTLNFVPMGLTSASLSATGFSALSSATIRVKSGTTVTVSTVLTTGIGSIAYDTGGWIKVIQ